MNLNLNPFDLTGPQFLLLYGVSLGVICVLTIAWRILQRVSQTESRVSQAKPLDVWELAYLRGRDLAVAQTAVIDLSTAKLIEIDSTKTKLLATSTDSHKHLSPVPFAIFRAAQAAGGVAASHLQREIAFECTRIRENLIDRGLIKTWGDRFWEVWVGYLGFSSLMLLGMVRISWGIFRDRPVGYLILLLLLTIVVGLILTSTSYLTPSGRQVLKDSAADVKRQQSKQPSSKSLEPIGDPNRPSKDPIPALPTLAFAVMGMAAVPTMLDPGIADLIRNRGMASESSTTGCSATGCGGGDGGGGGCGGGGCGGGGCGG